MKYKRFLILSLAFLWGLIFGGFLRFLLFAKTQVYLFEKNVMEINLSQTKLGGKTPEETWKLFVSELKKGNIDNAVQFIILDYRKNFKDYFERLKKEGKFEEFVKDLKNRKIMQLPGRKLGMSEDELLYTYLTEKEIIKVGEEMVKMQYYKDALKIDKKYGIPEEETFKEMLLEAIPVIIFKYNKYTGKWLIKSLFY